MTDSDHSEREHAAVRNGSSETRLNDDEAAAVEALRSILLGEDRRTVAGQEQRLHDIERLIGEDDRLIQRLTPTIAASIRRRVTEAPDELIEALYPVIVPMIGRAVAESVRDLVRQIDARMQRMFNLTFALRALWARLRGVSPAELALREALPFEPAEAMLIHRESGLLLAYSARPGAGHPDTDLISSMLTAIRDFAQDAFGQGQDGSLDAIQYGDRRILTEGFRHAYLAVVIDGIEPAGYRQELRQCLIRIDRDYSAALQPYQGDPAALAGVPPLLQGLLQPGEAPRGLTGSQRVILAGCSTLLVSALLAGCVLGGAWLRQAIDRPGTPAYVVALPPTARPSPSPTTSPAPPPTGTPAPTATLQPTATVQPTPSPTATPITGIMTGNVWAHAGPAGETTRTGVVVALGQPVELQAATGSWLLVSWVAQGERYSGWVPARYVRASAPAPTASVGPDEP